MLFNHCINLTEIFLWALVPINIKNCPVTQQYLLVQRAILQFEYQTLAWPESLF